MNTTTLLTAADVMSRDVLTVSPRETLRDALELMTEHHVTGMPVVTASGRCVGVVSASDVLGLEQEHIEQTVAARDEVAGYFNDETQRWETVRPTSLGLDELAELAVEQAMSPAVVSVAPEASLTEVARLMTRLEVHRVLVLDEQQRLLGIVSAFDFVRTWAETA